MVCTHEEIVGIRVWSTNSEELHQIVKLAMDVSADSNWALLYIILILDTL